MCDANALSRIPTEKERLNNIDTITTTKYSAEKSSYNLIRYSDNLLNQFKNQIIMQKDIEDSYKFHIPFATFHKDLISIKDIDSQVLLKILNRSVINSIKTDEDVINVIQKL